MSEKCSKTSSFSCNGGSIWFIGWLFTIGFLKTTFWKGVVALLLWPYFLGSEVYQLLEKAS